MGFGRRGGAADRGQNILLDPFERPAVIDWEYAQWGDPARDLAIVTRGVRQPFQIDGGLNRLLAAYRAYGGADVEVADVRFYELCLALGWMRDAANGKSRHETTDQAAARVARSLRWAKEGDR
jgi:aminoglycoside phosphotransferase (APT) family kinase protein